MGCPMKLRELKTQDPPADLPLLGNDDYTFLWISDYWDGPKSGMLLYKGREHWFETFREIDEEDSSVKWHRRFAVIPLTVEQLAREHEVHQDFQHYVGTHWDLSNPDKERFHPDRPKPIAEHHLFYDKHLQYCRSRPYDDIEVIAWFEQ